MQHISLRSPPLSPGVCSNSSSLSQWCYLTISSFATSFFFCFQSFSAFFSTELALCIRRSEYWSFSFSNSSSSEHSGLISFRIDWLDLLLPKGLSRVFSGTMIWKHRFFDTQPSLWSNTSVYDYWQKSQLWLLDLCQQRNVSAFEYTVHVVIAFLSRSKCLLIAWLQSSSTVIFKSKKIKSVTASTYSPSICHEVMGPDTMILVFWMLSFKPTFSISSFTFIKNKEAL